MYYTRGCMKKIEQIYTHVSRTRYESSENFAKVAPSSRGKVQAGNFQIQLSWFITSFQNGGENEGCKERGVYGRREGKEV